MEKKKEKLIFHYLTDEKRYELITESGKTLNEIVDEFIAKHDVNIIIQDDLELSMVRKHRTEINNLKNDIENARKQTTAVVVNPLANACKPLVDKLQECSERLSKIMETYKPKEEKQKTTSVITIEYPIGSDEIKKVKTYLNRAKIKYTLEEK